VVNKNKYLLPIVVLALILLFVTLTSGRLFGYAILDLDLNLNAEYSSGDRIDGSVSILLDRGELLPKGSIVKLTTSRSSYEFALPTLLDEGAEAFENEGPFFIRGKGLTGSGEGYGVPGEGDVPAEVSFDILIYPKIKSSTYERYIVPAPSIGAPGDEGDGGKTAKPSPIESGGSMGVGGGVSQGGGDDSDGGGAPAGLVVAELSGIDARLNSITGNYISPSLSSSESVKSENIPGVVDGEARFVTGIATNKQDYVYFLEPGESEGIVKGSVKIDGEPTDNDVVSFKVSDGIVTVSTDYSEPGKSFGEEFIHSGGPEIKLDLDEFGIVATGSGADFIQADLIWMGKVLASTRNSINILADGILKELEGSATIERVQGEAIVGQPVEWNARVVLSSGTERLVVRVPESDKGSEINGIIRTVSAGLESAEVNVLSGQANFVEKEVPEEVRVGSITGNVVTDIELGNDNFVSRSVAFVRRLFGYQPSSNVKEEINFAPIASQSVEALGNENGFVKGLEVKYYTSPPTYFEKERERGKEVFITSPLDYKDVIARIDISESWRVTNGIMVMVYSVDGELVDSIAYDSDGNGLVDSVDWYTGDLSAGEQKGYVIEISSAGHFNAEGKFLGDIYQEVKSLDGVWTSEILQDEFLRIQFESLLENGNDITVYSEALSGSPRIEAYLAGGNELIGEFPISDYGYNKLIFSTLQESEDSFDLKVIDGSARLDYVIDPLNSEPVVKFAGVTPLDGEGRGLDEARTFVELEIVDDDDRYYALVDFNDNLVMWMPMNLGTGDLSDLSSYGNTGTVVGSVSSDSGYWGRSVRFEGGHVSFGPGDEFSNLGSNRITISAWVKFDVDREMHIVSDMDDSGKGLALKYSPGKGLGFLVSDGSIDRGCFFDGSPDGMWHFVAGVYKPGTISCMVDGNWKSVGVDSGNFANSVYPSIGSLNSNSDTFAFEGSIDDVVVYNQALLRGAVLSLYDSADEGYSSGFKGQGDRTDRTNSFIGYAMDPAGQTGNTGKRNINVVYDSCLDFDLCTERQDCLIADACYLDVNKCDGDSCDFDNLTIEAPVYTLYDSSGNGRDLVLNVEDLRFAKDGVIVANGKSGWQGGDGGNLEINVKGLFYRRGARFVGPGGYSAGSNRFGGDGGSIIINYKGLNGNYEPSVDIRGGESAGDGHEGDDGEFTIEKDLTCNRQLLIFRDPDVTNDGLVDVSDYKLIWGYYGKNPGDEGYEEAYDMNCDERLDVGEMARIGFELRRGHDQ